MVRLMIAAERVGLTDPDVAWLVPAWAYKLALVWL